MTANEIAELRVKMDEFIQYNMSQDKNYIYESEYWCTPKDLETGIIEEFLEFLEKN